MPLVSQQPKFCELPELLLVGSCSFANFLENDQWSLLSDTWERFSECQGAIKNRSDSNRMFGLELYPSSFCKDRRWYYMACTEVTDLAQPFPTDFVSRFIPASRYASFTVKGPVTEIAPAFRYIYDEWLPNTDIKIEAAYDLELYDSRFSDPCSEESQVDILLPVE